MGIWRKIVAVAMFVIAIATMFHAPPSNSTLFPLPSPRTIIP